MFQITKITEQIVTAFCSKFSACNIKPFFNGKGRSRHKIFVYKQNYRLSPVVSSSPLYTLPLDFQCLHFYWNSSKVSQLYFNLVTSKVQSTALPGCIIYFIFEGLWGWKDSSVIKCACCSSRGLEFRFQDPCEMAYIKIYFIFIYEYVWCDYVCVHVCEWAWGLKEDMDPLKLELHVVVCCLTWVLGTEHRSSGRTAVLFTAEPPRQP